MTDAIQGGAGRELDALVAERVMGHPYAGAYRTDGPVVDDGRLSTCPHYSTDIAAAWLVAEVFIGMGCAAWLEGDGHTGYRAGVTTDGGQFEVDGDTPAHAICLAALAALAALDTPTAPPRTASVDGGT